MVHGGKESTDKSTYSLYPLSIGIEGPRRNLQSCGGESGGEAN